MNKSIIYKMDKLDTITSDPNNNNRGIPLQPPIDSMNKSYSLRPRSSIRSHGDLTDDDVILTDWRPRGRTKRRPKQKPPPLSKYRRKTANARERSRMREINEAFDTLRRAIPHLANDNSHSEKLTKITTLRLAMKYIAALNQVLKDPEPESDLDSGDYTLSLTPTSLSDHSDLYDQFLNASSTTSSTSCPFGSPSDDRQHLTKFDLSSSDDRQHLSKYELSSLDDRQHLTKFDLSSSDDRQHLTKFDLSSLDDRQHLSKFDLGSSDDRQHLTKFELSSSASLLPSSPYSPFEATSASMLDLRQHCLTPTDDFEADLDSFVTSAVDFEELFAS